MRRYISTASALFIAVAFQWPAWAGNVGNIAVIEDIGGTITATAMMPPTYLKNAACAFYADHDDTYDAIVVFSGVVLDIFSNIQQGGPLIAAAKGIGRDSTPDMRSYYCSKNKRLKNTTKMGTLSGASYALPDDPDDRAVIVPGFPLTGVELLAHEFGHYWLASVNYKKDNVLHCWDRGWECSGSGDQCTTGDLCDGVQESSFNNHWSYFMNSRSVMYGSFIEDLGNRNFKLTYPAAGYSQLDQYLMGLRLPSEVTQELFVVNRDGWDPTSGSASIPLQHNGSDNITGTRQDFTVYDVIAAEGPRDPEKEPCHWKTAFVLIYQEGKTLQEIKPLTDKLEVYRKRWEGYYDWATDHRGSMDTTINGSGPGTPTCPAPGWDGGFPDGGTTDSGVTDGGMKDGGSADASTDGGPKDGGLKDGGKTDGGGKDSGAADGSTGPDGGGQADSAVEADSGTGPDDSGLPEDDSGSGRKDSGGGAADDQAAGCSCSTMSP
jgi:hypothetical protein